MKRIRQSKFKVRWKCPNCGKKNKEPQTPWHDDFVVCTGCNMKFQVKEG